MATATAMASKQKLSRAKLSPAKQGKPNSRHSQRGMNLIEVMVVVSVAAIVLANGVPALQRTIDRYDQRGEVTRIISSLNYARSQAVNRQQVVTLGRSSDTDKDWSEGWTIYTDSSGNGDQAIDTGAGDVLLKDMSTFRGSSSIVANDLANRWISFDASGRIMDNGEVKIAICDSDYTSGIDGSLITINIVGRPRITTIDASDDNENDCKP